MANGTTRTGRNPQTKRTMRTMPLVRRRAGIPLKKKYAKSRKDVNKRLANLRTAVKHLQGRTYGETQLNDQAFYHVGDVSHSPGSPVILDLCSEQPIMWMVQAINNHAAVWQLKYDPTQMAGSRFDVQQIGSFDHQLFAYKTLNQDPVPALDDKYRTTQYWQNSQGVQAKYLLKDSYYEFDIACAGVNGFVELCAVSKPRNFLASRATNYTLPHDGLKSFVRTCKGSYDCNVVSSQVAKVRVLKRIYFQYLKPDDNLPAPPDIHPPAPPGGLPDDYPSNFFGPNRKILKIHVKSNNVIAVAVDNAQLGPGGTQVIDWSEIPTEQQTWLMLRTSINRREIQHAVYHDPPHDPPVLNPPGYDYRKRLGIEMRRVVKWKDFLGNSLS